MKIAKNSDETILFLEEEDFRSKHKINILTKISRDRRYNKVLIPEKYFGDFEDKDLYKAIEEYFYIGGGGYERVMIAKFIKY